MTNFSVTVTNPADADGSARPYIRDDGRVRVHRQTGQLYLRNGAGLQVLSSLRKDEWEALDGAVQRAARLAQAGFGDLRSRGLVKAIPFETVVSQWNTVSEVTAAEESITGEGNSELANVDFELNGVTVPVIMKGFRISRRMLLASRRAGEGLDTVTAFEAGQAVGEKREDMLFNGSTVNLNANPIRGYTTHPDRLTDTAANYGGGDWGTATNIVPTVVGMVSAATAQRFRGPFVLYCASPQYDEAALTFPSTDNNSTHIDRLLSLESIQAVKRADFLAAGNIVLVQLTENVVDAVEASDIQVVEWASGDGMTSNFKVMAVAAPRVRSTHAGRIGLVHATGA